MTRIYTRSGDSGMTSLGSKERVSKDSQRVSSYGEIDELNSVIGLAISLDLESMVEDQLKRIQGELFNLGTELANPKTDDSKSMPQIGQPHTDQLEIEIDKMSEMLGPLRNFILPGGSPGASALHVARSVCRRAERSIISLKHLEPVDPQIIIYVNRLSDALFIMARYENQMKDVSEMLWGSRID